MDFPLKSMFDAFKDEIWEGKKSIIVMVINITTTTTTAALLYVSNVYPVLHCVRMYIHDSNDMSFWLFCFWFSNYFNVAFQSLDLWTQTGLRH